jgi:cystathionine beta-lyase/cystathionine gamma-synthase
MTEPKPTKTYRPATTLVHGGTVRSGFDETAEALFLTSGFVYASAEQAEATFAGNEQHFQYSRFGNPTVAMLENRLAQVEGAEACRATATGMAAVHAAILSQVKAGDRVVASRALFGSCHWIVSTLLPRYGVETEFVDGADLAAWRAALSRPATLVLLESPSNPMLEIVDLRAVAALAHAAGAIVVVDNVFATPLLQKPLELGADVVVYSLTKHSDGQGRVLGGAVLGRALHPQHRAVAVAVQRLAAAEGARDAGAACRGGEPRRRESRDLACAPARRRARVVPDAAGFSATRAGGGADAGRWHAGHVRAARRQSGGLRADERAAVDPGVQQSR